MQSSPAAANCAAKTARGRATKQLEVTGTSHAIMQHKLIIGRETSYRQEYLGPSLVEITDQKLYCAAAGSFRRPR